MSAALERAYARWDAKAANMPRHFPSPEAAARYLAEESAHYEAEAQRVAQELGATATELRVAIASARRQGLSPAAAVRWAIAGVEQP